MAFRGIDFRDLYRRGSGMTPRRLLVLLRAIPLDDPLWLEVQAAEEEAQTAQTAQKATPDQIRDRQAAFEARNAAQRAKEAQA